jgi:hypothetical protein
VSTNSTAAGDLLTARYEHRSVPKFRYIEVYNKFIYYIMYM